MKITLVADVSANGRLLLTDKPHHPVPETTVQFYINKINEAGGLIIGRKTMEVFEKDFGGIKQLFPGTEVVVLSKVTFAKEGIKVIHNHQEALNYFQQKGFNEVVIGGGTEVYNLYLNNNLVTDIYFNYVPVIVGDGGILGTSNDLLAKCQLIQHTLLEDGIFQMHLIKKV